MASLAYVALGSNLGNRQSQLSQALALLAEISGNSVRRHSNFHETAPVGGPPEQGAFLNAAAIVETTLEPLAFLRALQAVEKQLGRVRQERWGPRTLDLDLLIFDRRVLHTPELTLPHPLMQQRSFVLNPLAEIAPDLIHPLLNKSIDQLRRELADGETSAPSLHRPLAGRRSLVTGSTSGIGLAIARALAQAGADVLVHRRAVADGQEHAARLHQAESIAGELRKHSVRSMALLADLQDPDDCRRLIEAAWKSWNGIDIWINNAGADTLTGPAAAWGFDAKLQALWQVDVRATMLLAREAGQRMAAQGSGCIINMGWDQSDTGMEGDSGQLFAAAKAAVHGFTKSLALSLAPKVRVNCLAPGWIKTAWGEGASTFWQDRVLRETPLARWGLPGDVASTACWLASPAAEFITGQIIRVNGGAVRA
jgi:2-amino-4-hydroxy-6-hydroxymethyldihydropteridine diphosphokinase